MKDQVTALMEALRRVQLETDRYRWGSQNARGALKAIGDILKDPAVAAAVENLEAFVPSPGLVPDTEDLFANHEV